MSESFVSIFSLASKIKSLVKKKTTYIIGIDGPENADKSLVAESLRRVLPLSVILPLDDFYSVQLGDIDRKRVLSQVISSLKNNEIAKYQRFDRVKNGLMEWRNVQTGTILLVEGNHALHRDLRSCYDLTIWVGSLHKTVFPRGVHADYIFTNSRPANLSF